MTALYRDGRQADALAAYRVARSKLVAEIGKQLQRDRSALPDIVARYIHPRYG